MNNVQLLHEPLTSSNVNKPIELYVFIDPLSSKAIGLIRKLRKLLVQYDHYFTWRFVLSTELVALNSICSQTKDYLSDAKLDITHPVLPSIAVKAAELQGKRAGSKYLMKLQEYSLIKELNINSYSTLVEVAKSVNLDIEEFESDFGSPETAKAFQCDLYITREMGVDEVPSIVFFNECIEDEGLKLSGEYPYEIYEQVLQEMLGEALIPQKPLTIFELLSKFYSLTTEEIADILEMPLNLAECELKKQMIQQHLERIQTDTVTLWRLKN